MKEDLVWGLRSDLGYGQVRRVGLDVATGLGQMHARGICHHDVKGANILLREEDDKHGGTVLRAYLADLGMAGWLRQTRSQAQRCAPTARCLIWLTASSGSSALSVCCACHAAARLTHRRWPTTCTPSSLAFVRGVSSGMCAC